LLRLCLQKDAKKRRQAAGDIRIDIEQAVAEPVPIPTDVAAAQQRSLVPWAVAAALAGALVMVAWAPWRSDTPDDRPLVQLDVDLGAEVALPVPGVSVEGSSVAISPDGMRLAYVSGSPTRLFMRRLDQPEAIELGETQGALMPFFSPDGQWIGFVVENELNKISVEGSRTDPNPGRKLQRPEPFGQFYRDAPGVGQRGFGDAVGVLAVGRV
jgi:hypothetical protein